MKRTIALFATLVVALLSAGNAFAGQAPDAPGTKMFTVRVGGLPGMGANLDASIAMANLGSAHLYGGLQLGADLRKGYGASRTDLSLAPRLTLGFNLSRVVEMHAGGVAGIAMRKVSSSDYSSSPSLIFCYGGFGGFRFNVSDSLGIVLEGCYSHCLPYATAGLAFRF